MSQTSFEKEKSFSPIQFRMYMDTILSWLTDEQHSLLLCAIEIEYKTKLEKAITLNSNIEDATWRVNDIRKKVMTKSILNRIDRRICSQYLRTHFIAPLETLIPDLKSDPERSMQLKARIQVYKDLVTLLNKTYRSKKL